MAGSVKVFGSPASTEVARVLACLFEKDVEFELTNDDSSREKLKPQGMMGIRGPSLPRRTTRNSLGNGAGWPVPNYRKVPITFKDGNVTLAESRKILWHIADKYKTKGNRDLSGRGPLERSSIKKWLQIEEQSFDVHSAGMAYSLAYLPPTMELDASSWVPPEINPAQDEMLHQFRRSWRELGSVLDVYEQQLEKASYLAGDMFTLADLSHLPGADLLASDPRSLRLLRSRKNVSRWWGDISGRESWKKVKDMQRSSS